MSQTDKQESAKKRRVITPEFRLSYPNLFKAVPGPQGGEAKFSAALLFDAGTDLATLKAAAIFAAREKWGAKADDMIRGGKLRLPFRDDWEEKGYPEGTIFMNVRTNNKPGVVSNRQDPDTKRPIPITDESEIYPGCYGRASLTAFAYDTAGNKGVSFALNNFQKLRDGDRLDNRVAAEDEFDADMADEPASLNDLM